MDKDDGGGIPQDGDLEDFARVYHGSIKDADAEKVGADDLIATVEEHNPCFFPVELGESVLEECIDVLWMRYFQLAFWPAVSDKLHANGVLIKNYFGRFHLAFPRQHKFA